MNEYAISVDEAMERLAVIPDYDCGNGPEPCVHTFVSAGFGLLGAHWPVDDLRALMEKHGVEDAGDEAATMGHSIVVVRPDPEGPLFIASAPQRKGSP